MLTHVVLFKLADPTEEAIDEISQRLRALVGPVESLRSMTVGRNIVASDRAYDLALIATFDDREGLDAYQVHPDHVEVAGFIRSRMIASASVDFIDESG